MKMVFNYSNQFHWSGSDERNDNGGNWSTDWSTDSDSDRL